MKGLALLECVRKGMLDGEMRNDLFELLFFRQLRTAISFLLFCTKTKRKHTNQTFEMSRLITCAVPFSVGVFYNVVLSTQPLIWSVNYV